MTSSKALPSLLVFGPQNGFPSEEVLEDLRQELINNPQLSALAQAVDELPELWDGLIESDESLIELPGDDYLGQLRQWIIEGGAFPHRQGHPPNLYAWQLQFFFRSANMLGTLGTSAMVPIASF